VRYRRWLFGLAVVISAAAVGRAIARSVSARSLVRASPVDRSAPTIEATAAPTSGPSTASRQPSGPVVELAGVRVRDGDLVFQESLSAQSSMVGALTRSPWTHMGVVFIDDGAPMVFEANARVGKAALASWVARGRTRSAVVKRLRNADDVLTPSALEAMRELSNGWMALPYDAQFLWSDRAMYCSELAYKLFERGAHVAIGRIQHASELELSDDRVQRALRERFRPGEFNPAEAVVTPASMFTDEQVVIVGTIQL
jgi:hypothetical protein